MLKIILDTNMILSGALFGGMVEKIIDLIVENKLRFYISSVLVDETFNKLKAFKASEVVIEKVNTVFKKGISVLPESKVTVCRDLKDNFLLELAQEAQVDYLITRDKDLLDLHTWKNTRIIKPEDFLPFLRKMKLL